MFQIACGIVSLLHDRNRLSACIYNLLVSRMLSSVTRSFSGNLQRTIRQLFDAKRITRCPAP